MKSAEDGQFNVKGLDAGTYYLRRPKLLPITIPAMIPNRDFSRQTETG